MTWAGVGVGVSVVGGIMGSNSAKKAAKQQAAAIREATALQRQMYNTTREDLSGYRNIGGTALDQMNQIGMPEMTKSFTASDFVKDPGYDFRMAEGAKALERSAAARGGLMGGAAGKAMARYGQDYASNEYQNVYDRFNNDRDQRFNKLSSLVNIGQNSAAQTGNAAQNFGNQAGQNMIGAGNAQAAGTIAGSNAWSGAIQGGLEAAAMYGGGGANGVSKMGTMAGNYSQPSNLSEMIKHTA